MATQPTTARRGSIAIPFLTLVVAALVVAGLAIGAQALRSSTTTGAFAPAPAATTAGNDAKSRDNDIVVPNPAVNDAKSGDLDIKVTNPGKPVSIPLPKRGGPSAGCTALDARAYVPYCGVSDRTRIDPPRATWLACASMDPATYRQLCNQGDGGRWVEGARSAGL